MHEIKFKFAWRWKFLKLVVDKRERVTPAGLGVVLKLLVWAFLSARHFYLVFLGAEL